MDKISFLVYCADCALKKSSSMLYDECPFGSSSRSALTGCDEGLEEIFVETNESYSDERQDHFTISCLLSYIANVFYLFMLCHC